nr:hypothetical protein Iba_chr10aCG15560 [Ipomoea batatas]
MAPSSGNSAGCATFSALLAGERRFRSVDGSTTKSARSEFSPARHGIGDGTGLTVRVTMAMMGTAGNMKPMTEVLLSPNGTPKTQKVEMPGAQLNNPSLFADLAAEITSHLVLQNHPDFPVRVVQPAEIWQVVFEFGVVNPQNHGRKPTGMRAFPQRYNSAQMWARHSVA